MTEKMTLKEVADLLECTEETVIDNAGAGKLAAVKFGRSWVFLRSALMEGLHLTAMANLKIPASRPPAAAPTARPPASHLSAPPDRLATPSTLAPPPSEPSDRDRVIEEYAHCGMKVRIYRDAGFLRPPSYFAVVINPAAKQPSGAVMHADSYPELRAKAEARAERKATLLREKQDAVLAPAKSPGIGGEDGQAILDKWQKTSPPMSSRS